jgi:hypothetical protein
VSIKNILSQKVMVPEPYAVIQVLPKCAGCGAIHPMARKPKLHVDNCPDCGTPVDYGEPQLEKAAVGGIMGLLFYAVVGIGKGLLKLGRWVQPKKD